MDAEDLDYELMQQYEDQLYGDQGSDGSESEGIESDVEDAVLSRLYYTSNSKGISAATAKETTKEPSKSAADSSPPHSAIENRRKRTFNQLSSSDSDSEEDSLKMYNGYSTSSDVGMLGDDSRQASCEAESDADDDSDNDSIAFTPAKEDDIPITKIIDLEQPVEVDDVQDADEYAYMDNAAFQDRNRYFQDEEGRKKQSSRFACYLCGQTGHQQKDCPRCKTCGSMEHGTRDCMSNVQCFRCKKMGHRSADCKNASSSECFRCGSLLHNHDDCPSIWRIYKVTVKKNPNDIWCCHCAARGHSYLNCNAKNAFARERIMARDSGRRNHMSHRGHHENRHHRYDRHERERSPPTKIQKSSRRSDTSVQRSRHDDYNRHRRDEQVSHPHHHRFNQSSKQNTYNKSFNQAATSNYSKTQQKTNHSNHTPTNHHHRSGKDSSRRAEPQPTRSGTMQLPSVERRNGNSYSNDFPRNPPKLPQPTSSGIIGLPPASNRGSPRYRGGYRAAV